MITTTMMTLRKSNALKKANECSKCSLPKCLSNESWLPTEKRVRRFEGIETSLFFFLFSFHVTRNFYHFRCFGEATEAY
jgi:hypothetical protein